jgi:hypothetical protein
MRALTGEALLAAWEAAAQLPELLRPLALLAAADPAGSAFLSALPLAKRDLNLVRLHTMSFSPDLAVFGTCPDCGERLEFALPADEVAASLSAPADARPVEWIEDGRAFRLRPVTTDDLVAVAGVPDPDAAQDLLLALCLAGPGPEAQGRDTRGDVRPGDEEPGVEGPDPEVLSTEAPERFEELNADAEIQCALDCPACGGHHVHDLDIARFVWREVAVAASRLLAEVHVLASAYGWPERDILRLTPHRRAAYVELVAG